MAHLRNLLNKTAQGRTSTKAVGEAFLEATNQQQMEIKDLLTYDQKVIVFPRENAAIEVRIKTLEEECPLLRQLTKH